MENINMQEELLNQDPPSKELWSRLKEMGLYEKDYKEFSKLYSNPNEVDFLYKLLSAPKVELYTNSKDDFYKDYFPDVVAKAKTTPAAPISNPKNVLQQQKNAERKAENEVVNMMYNPNYKEKQEVPFIDPEDVSPISNMSAEEIQNRNASKRPLGAEGYKFGTRKPLSKPQVPASTIVKQYETKAKSFTEIDKLFNENMDNPGGHGWAVPNLLRDLSNFVDEKIFGRDIQEEKLNSPEFQRIASTRHDARLSFQESLKEVEPIIKALPKDMKVDGFTKINLDGFKVVDPIKISEYAKKKATELGVPDDGFFYELLKNEAQAHINHKLIEPEVDKEFNDLFKKETGKTFDEAVKGGEQFFQGLEQGLGETEVDKNRLTNADFKAGYTEAAKLKQNTLAQSKIIHDNILAESKKEIADIAASMSSDVNKLVAEIKRQADQINEAFAPYIKNGEFVGTPEQFEQYKASAESLTELQNQAEAVQKQLSIEFLKQQNDINSKADRRYRRQLKEITASAKNKLDALNEKYGKIYEANPELEATAQKLYEQAYGNVVGRRESLKTLVDEISTQNGQNLGYNFFRHLVPSLGGSIKGISSHLNYDTGKLVGDWMESIYSPGSSEINSLKDYLNPTLMSSSIGNLTGTMIPGITATAATVALTRGMGGGALLQSILGGAASYVSETADMAGRMKDEKFAETGDPVAAQKAADEIVEGQKAIIMAYGADALPFMGKAVKLGRNMFTRVLIGGSIEVSTEVLQEYPQNLIEEAVKDGGSWRDAIRYHSAEKLKHTLLNVGPMFLMGAGGQLRTDMSVNVESAAEKAGKAFALKNKIKDISPTHPDQLIFDMMQRQGEKFTSSYLLTAYTNGDISQDEFNRLGKSMATAATVITNAKDLQLTPAQSKVFAVFTYAKDDAAAKLEKEQDPVLRSVMEAKIKDIDNILKDFALNKKANFVSVTYGDNSQYLYTFAEAEELLQNADFQKALKNNEALVAVFGDGEKITSRLKELGAPKISTSEQETMADEMKNALTEDLDEESPKTETTKETPKEEIPEVTPIVPEVAPVIAPKPETSSEETKPASDVQVMKVSDIHTNEDKFQGRFKLKQKKVDKIAKNWNDKEQDPVHVWRGADGKFYVLSGHHRLAAAKQAGREDIKITDRSNEFTEAEAIKFAKEEANANRTMESSMERANTLREKRERGDSKEEIKEFLENEGKNGLFVNNLSHLNKNGRTLSVLVDLEDSDDKVTQKEAEKIADWIGEARRSIGGLTDAHEEEMFKFLMNKEDSKRISTKADFIHKVRSVFQPMMPGEALNLKRFKYKSEGESHYDELTAEKKDAIQERQNKINEINDRFINPNNPNYISTKDRDYDSVRKIADEQLAKLEAERKKLKKELEEIQAKKGTFTSSSRTLSIFDQIPEGDTHSKDIKNEDDIIENDVTSENIKNTGLVDGENIHQEDIENTKKLIDEQDNSQHEQAEQEGLGVPESTEQSVRSESVAPGRDAGAEQVEANVGEDAKRGQAEVVPGTESVPRKRVTEKLTEKAKKELDDLWDDLANEANKLGGNIIPEEEVKKQVLAAKVIAKFVEVGIYKFADIVAAGYEKFGKAFEDIFEYIKKAYTTTQLDVSDEISDKMDSLKDVKKFDYYKFIQDVYHSTGDSQRDSGNATDDKPNDGGMVQGNRGTSRAEGGADASGSTESNKQQQRSESIDSLPTTTDGKRSDNELYQPIESLQSESGATGTIDGRGNRIDSAEGLPNDKGRNDDVDPGTEKQTGSFAEQVKIKIAEQKKAESIPVQINDADNIRQTLPLLLPEQQEDVIKAEKRFFSDEHKTAGAAYGKGMLFTNGTGTGKTFSGLGIIKRFVKSGKKNVLIVVPSQPKVTDWSKSGEIMGLTITPLEDTKTGGEGVVVTTYANFRSNQELLKRDFDLIVYDESHRLMESKDGTASSTTSTHSLMGNESIFAAYNRITQTHPLWIREREVSDEIRKEYISTNNLDLTDEQYNTIRKKTDELESEIKEIKKQQELLRPELEARAKAAYENTKVVFLSATPFKAHFNLRYANKFLFDWGDETITNSRGSRVNPEAQFFLQHFGSRYEWKYHRLQVKESINEDAVSMQEVSFANMMMKNGVMSGRSIESNQDYSREFPKVSGAFNSELFNKAYSSIYDFENNKYEHLRVAARGQFADYQYTTRLMEALKTSMSVERIQNHLDLGRKVVIFHRRKQAGSTPPFNNIYKNTISDAKAVLADENARAEDKEKAAKAIEQAEQFKIEFADLFEYEQTLNYNSAIQQIEEAFPGRTTKVNGDVIGKHKAKAIAEFNNDDSGKDIILIQEESGKEGVSLHDISGKHQRVLISLSMPISTTTALQVEGRIFRIGQMTDAIFEYPLLGLDLETEYYGKNINVRLGTTENLALGDSARDLIRSFSEGVLFNSTSHPPTKEQGKGGKELDRREASVQTPFEKAKLVYATNQKNRARRDQREGFDYFATPEPLGQKMVEWGGLKPGQSIMEPSAGHGAIAMWAPTSVSLTAIEPSYELYSKLSARAGGGTRKIINQRFEDYNIINKYDVVTMNPPFGHSGKTAMDHVEKAYKHLKNGGRLIAILPNSPTLDKRLNEFLYGETDKGKPINPDAYLRKTIVLPKVTFDQAGTQVSSKVVIIDKVVGETDEYLQSSETDISHAKTIGEFFDTIEHISAPDRVKITEEVQAEIKPETGDDIIMQPAIEYKHSKTGEILQNVKITKGKFVEDFASLKKIAAKYDGYYSSFSSVRGFLFKTKENADNFQNEVNNPPTENTQSGVNFSAKRDYKTSQTYTDRNPVTQTKLQERFPDAVVVQDQSELPPAVLKEAEKQGITDIEGVYYQGKVYLIANNLSDMGRANAVYRHEKIGHQGVINHLGNKINGFSVTLIDGAKGGQLSTLNKMAREMFGKDTSQLSELEKTILGQEYIAEMAERPGKDSGTWAKFMAFVRGTLRELGINVRVTDSEIKVLLDKVSKQNAPTNKVINDLPLFSLLNPKGTGTQIKINFQDAEKAGKSGETQKIQVESATANGAYASSGNVQRKTGTRESKHNFRSVGEIWKETKSLDFTGTMQVKNATDVAYIMKALETKNVEHAFVVHVDAAGNSHIQHLGSGGINAQVFDIRIVLSGVKKFGSKKVYLVHNHPSGNLKPSSADIDLTARIREGLNAINIPVEHVIMDTESEGYVHIDYSGYESVNQRPKSAQAETELVVHTLDGQKALSQKSGQIKSSKDIAEIIYGMRFSKLPKLGMLVLNQRNEVIANTVFTNSDNKNLLKSAIEAFAGNAIGTSVAFYGNEGMSPLLLKIKNLKNILSKLDIHVLDVVSVKSVDENTRKVNYDSAMDSGLMEPEMPYGQSVVNDPAQRPLVRDTAKLIKELRKQGKTDAELIDAAVDHLKMNWDDAKWGPFDEPLWRSQITQGIQQFNNSTTSQPARPAGVQVARAKFEKAMTVEAKKSPGLISRTWNLFKNLSYYIDNPNRYITQLQQSIEKMNDTGKLFDIPLGRIFEQSANGEALYNVHVFLKNVLGGLKGKKLEEFKKFLFYKRVKDRLVQNEHNKAFNLEYPARDTGNITLQDAEAMLADQESRLGEEAFADFERRGEELQIVMRTMMERLVESGKLSQESYNEIISQNDFYAPFNVVQSLVRYDGDEQIGQETSTIKKISGITYKDGSYSINAISVAQKALKDGNISTQEFYNLALDILDNQRAAGLITEEEYHDELSKLGDPGFKITDMLDKIASIIYDSYRLAHKNDLMNRLGELVQYDSANDLIYKVKGHEVRYTADGQAYMVPKRVSDIRVPEGFGVITYHKAGIQQYLVVPIKAANTINNIDRVLLPGWALSFNLINKIFRTSVITLSPGFQIANYIIDTLRTAMLSRYGLLGGRGVTDRMANMLLYVPQLIEALGHSFAANVIGYKSNLYIGFMRSKAFSAGMFDDPFLEKKSIKGLMPKSFVDHIKFGGVDKLWRLANNIGSTFEQAHKIMNVERGMDIDAGIRTGIARWKNLISKANTSLEMSNALDRIVYETQNFAGSPNFPATHGFLKVLSVIFQFLSARVKGEMSDYRRILTIFGSNKSEAIKISAGERAGLMAQFLATASPIIYMAIKNVLDDDDDELKTLSPYDRQNNMLIPIGTFEYTDDNGETKTHTEYVKIPLRGVTSSINVMAMQFSLYAKEKDPELLKEAIKVVGANLTPLNIHGDDTAEMIESIYANTTPLVKTMYEIPANRDAFRHRDLIPETFGVHSMLGKYKASKNDPNSTVKPYHIATSKTPEIFVNLSKTLYEDLDISITPIMLDYLHRTYAGNIMNNLDKDVLKKRLYRSESNYPVYRDYGGTK